MKCPIDSTVDLVMTDRSGIEIDYCPTCRGVWLDRGELDKIIERTQLPAAATILPATAAAKPPRWDDDDHDHDDHRHRSSDDHRRRPKKRSSLLGELFDF